MTDTLPTLSSELFEQQVECFKKATLYLLIINNHIIDTSDKLIELLGYKSKEEMPQWFPQLIPNHHPKEFLVYHKLVTQHHSRENFDLKLIGADHRIVTMRFTAQPLSSKDSDCVVMLVGEDVTYQHKKLDDLSESSSLFQYNPYSIIITDAKGIICKVNPKFVKKTQYSEAEVIGQSIFDFKHIPGADANAILNVIIHQKDYRAEFISMQKDGMQFDEDLYVIPVYDYGELTRILFIGEDVSVQKQIMHSLEQKAYYDDLTGFYRKEVGYSLLYEICDSGQNFGIFFLDYRSFKKINESFNEQVGDQVLKIGSERLRLAMRQQDIFVRWQGDEFIVIAPNLNDSNDMNVVADKIMSAFHLPFTMEEHPITVNVDLGGCYCQMSKGPVVAREIIKVAHGNMHVSKQGELLICTSIYGKDETRAIRQYQQ